MKIIELVNEIKSIRKTTDQKPIIVMITGDDLPDDEWNSIWEKQDIIDWAALKSDMLSFIKSKRDIILTSEGEAQSLSTLVDFLEKYMDSESKCIYKVYTKSDFNIGSDVLWASVVNIVNDDFDSFSYIIKRLP